MSALGDTLKALKDALLLSEEVKRAGARLEAVADELRELDRRNTAELRDMDRRVTRLEAQWETAMALSARPAPAQRQLPGEG